MFITEKKKEIFPWNENCIPFSSKKLHVAYKYCAILFPFLWKGHIYYNKYHLYLSPIYLFGADSDCSDTSESNGVN
jgi:hypothetical protein